MGKQLFTDWAMIFGIYMYLCNAKEVGLFVTFDDNTDAHKFAGVHTQYVDPSSLFGSLPETEKKNVLWQCGAGILKDLGQGSTQ